MKLVQDVIKDIYDKDTYSNAILFFKSYFNGVYHGSHKHDTIQTKFISSMKSNTNEVTVIKLEARE